ncbi:PfkB family carbohydrate kinase [Litorivicinus sp.]|nr:PfkB family carbohydrate kinase [Litorivicinus sp.]
MRNRKSKKDLVVFVSGNFNILHLGHIRLLRYAKGLGDKLVVGLNKTGAEQAETLLPVELRLEALTAIAFVDDVVIIDGPVVDVVADIKPDIVVKGKEYEKAENEEQQVLKAYDGALVFSSGDITLSNGYLTDQMTSVAQAVSVNFSLLNQFRERRKVSLSSLSNHLCKFNDLKICVIGDVIVDEYISCDPLGMSREDPTIVVTPLSAKKFVGGAGIVAAHAASLGASVDFFGLAGDDLEQEFAVKRLKAYQVNANLIVDKNRPTTLKTRYRANGKTLLRVSRLHQESISQILQQQLISLVKDRVSEYDLLIFSDFNYGCLPSSVVNKITSLCLENGVKVAADSQSSSQIGDISRFKKASLLTPTEYEVRVAVRDNENGLVVIADSLLKESNAENLIVTLGAEGIFLRVKDQHGDYCTERLAALNDNPLDVAGAGDSLLVMASLVLAAGGSIFEAAVLGSIAAALQVGIEGSKPLDPREIHKVLSSRLLPN